MLLQVQTSNQFYQKKKHLPTYEQGANKWHESASFTWDKETVNQTIIIHVFMSNSS